MKSFVKGKKMLVILALFIGVFSLVLLTNKANKVEENTIYKDGIRQLDYNEVQLGEETISGTNSVTFDAYFSYDTNNDNQAEKYRGNSLSLDESGKLWIEFKILDNITLKDAYIEFQNTNVTISGAIVKDSVFSDTVVSNNITRIPLNELNTSVTKLFYVDLNANLSNDITSYSANNKVVLKGTVVQNEQEVEVEKEVTYLVNWYGTSNTIGTDSDRDYKVSAPIVDFSGEDNVVVTYEITVKETKDLMLLKSSNIMAYIGQLNGYDPISVVVDTDNVTYNYNEQTKILTAELETVLDNNNITKQCYNYIDYDFQADNQTYYVADDTTGFVQSGNGTYSDPNNINKSKFYRVNKYKIVVTYPHASSYKTGTASLNLISWYEGYNNSELADETLESGRTSKVYIANYQCDDTTGFISTIFSDISINAGQYDEHDNTYIDTTNVYNAYSGEEAEDILYEVAISPYTGGYNIDYPIKGITITDFANDQIGNINTNDFITYDSISFSTSGTGAISYALGYGGYVKLIDNDTNELLYVFNATNWNSTYHFDKDVRSIRLETSEPYEGSIVSSSYHSYLSGYHLFTVYITKRIDTKYIVNNYSKDSFANWNYLGTTVRTDWVAGTYNSANDVEDLAGASGKIVQRFSSILSPGASEFELKLATTDQKDRLKFQIDTKEYTFINKGYKNGEFLIKIPEEILSINVVSIKDYNESTYEYNIENNNNKYEIIERDGQRFLKIYTENEEHLSRYRKEVIVDIVKDPRVVNRNITFDAYAYNPKCNFYRNEVQDIYDANNNGDREENLGYASVSYSIIAPYEIITAESLTNYNVNGDAAVSPLIAEIRPLDDNGDATVNIYVINNYGNAIKDIKVIGKIGYIGNTSQIGNIDLNSEFNVTMTSDGISVPTEISDNTKVYYSEVETPSDDVNDSTNGWVEVPANFDNIKSYMIVVDDYSLEYTENLTFTYNIKVPTDTENIHKKTYFTHGVYFNTITDGGDLSSSAGSEKLGIMMVRKYDLNIKTYRINTDKEITRVSYEIEDENGNIQTVVPNVNGILEIKNLYVGENYKFRQKYIVDDYEIDSEEKTFKVSNGTNDVLELTNTGTYKEIKLENNNLYITIENVPRYTLVLKNTDLNTEENIVGSKFTITGKGYEDGYTIITDKDGNLTLKGLYINEEYEIQQLTSYEHAIHKDKFIIKLGIDPKTNDIKLTYKKYPDLDNLSFVKLSDLTTSTISINDSNEYVSTPESYYNEYISEIAELDLTNYDKTYYLTFEGYHASYFGTYVVMFLTNYIPANFEDILEYGKKPYSYSNSITLESVLNSDGTQSNLVGGEKYYIGYYRKPGYSSNFTIRPNIYVSYVESNREMERARIDELSSTIDGDERLIQTLDDDINNNQPILNVNVKNPGIPTSNFKIVKKDAETGALLAGATYRLEGPGISGNGIILVTDENGEASYKVYQHYLGDYSDAGFETLSSTENYYSIQELSAPNGYAIDSTKIYFRFNNKIKCPSNEQCTLSNYTSEYSVIYAGDEFKNTTYDEETNTLIAEVHDYPLIRITKTDAETGQIIPNTFFAINKVTIDNGRKILSDAFDIDGNVVGEKVVINDVEYNVIATDSNGKININLEKGQYLIKEVQASDEKYELSDQEYYFGVGETVPYQAEGIVINDFIEFSANPNASINYVQSTSDGGYLVNYYTYISKYDKNNNLVWNLKAEDVAFEAKQVYSYFDKPDVITENKSKYIGFRTVFELANGDVLVSAAFQVYDIKNLYYHTTNTRSYLVFFRISPTGEVRYPDGSDKFYITYNYHFTEIKKRETYHYNYYDIVATSDSTMLYYGNDAEDEMNIPTNDGRNELISIIPLENGGYYAAIQNNSNDERYLLVEYDANDEEVRRVNISGIVKQEMTDLYTELASYSQYTSGLAGYYISIGSPYFDKINLTSDGDILYSVSEIYSLGASYLLKIDQDFNKVYFKPIFLSDNYFPYGTNMKGYRTTSEGIEVITYSDGHVYDYYRGIADRFKFGIEGSLDNEDIHFILKYDNDGNPIKAIPYSMAEMDEMNPENNKYIVKNTSYRQWVVPFDDGHVVAAEYSAPSGSGANLVTLASGETIEITGDIILYYVNDDGRVEWLKQYNSDGYINSFFYDGEYLSLVTCLSKVKDVDGNYVYNNLSNYSYYYGIIRFKKSDAVSPEGPEEYVLNIENKRKEFSINVVSDEGSTVSIKNINNAEIFNGNGETLSEKVKYGDNSVNEITITLNSGNILKSVKLNGKNFSYKVNDDGTITLDKIPEIKENKTIEIETEDGLRSVIVHHYKENTTERIASDEIITGIDGSEYLTHPVVSNLYAVTENIPLNYTGTFSETNEVVIYYYTEKEVELNVNYVEEETEDEIKEPTIERKTLGSSYQTTPANIPEYSLVGVRGNEQGYLNRNVTRVTYLYRQGGEPQAVVTVLHEDANTHEEIAPRTYVEVPINEPYQTSASSEIPAKYKYVDRTANAEDVALTSEIEVIYYYDLKSYNVSVEKNIKSISVNGENIQLTNNKTISLGVHAADSVVVTYEIVLTNDGEVDADFDVLEEDIDNFEVSNLGSFTADTNGYILSTTLPAGQTATYEIEYTWDQEHFGSSTNHVELDNVDNNLELDEPDEDDNESETTVTLTSVDSLITVKHEDINTHEEIAPRTYVNGTLNEAYQTSVSSSIPANYRYADKTANAEDVALESAIEVIYYYEIIPFNVSVDKKIDSVTVNGENISISDSKSEKITITKDDEVIVYYEIELKNSGEVKAEFTILEEDVNNFEIYDLGDFEASNGEYILTTTLEPGETKTYKIGYKWKQGKYGISSNRVEVEDVTNELGFDEPDTEDNISMTAILIQEKEVLAERDENPNTSDTIYKSIITFIMSLVGLLSAMFMYMKKKKFEI